MKNEEKNVSLIKKSEDGQEISPVLPDEVKNYLIDIDGTICDDIPNEQPERMETPRTISRRHRPHSGLSLTHSTPGDHTLVRPPGHWLRPHLSVSIIIVPKIKVPNYNGLIINKPKNQVNI